MNELFVAIVGGDSDVRESMGTLLSVWGVEVLLAETDDDCITLLDRRKIVPDIVITNTDNLDSKTGISAIRRIRLFCGHNIAGVVVRNDFFEMEQRKFVDNNVVIYSKPLDSSELSKLLKDFVTYRKTTPKFLDYFSE